MNDRDSLVNILDALVINWKRKKEKLEGKFGKVPLLNQGKFSKTRVTAWRKR